MDRVTRLIVAALLAVVSCGAFAFDSVPPQIRRTYTSGTCSGDLAGFLACFTAQRDAQGSGSGSDGGCSGTWSQSGSAGVISSTDTSKSTGSINVYYTYTRSFSGSGAGACGTFHDSYTGGSTTGVAASATWADAAYCADGSSLVGSGATAVCACNSGYMPNASKTACYQYTCPVSGSYTSITQPDQLVTNAGDSLCTGGCGYQPSSWKVGQDGKIWATWPFKSTGSFCGGDKRVDNTLVDSGEKNSKNPAPVPCGANQCPGQVNGATVCVACKGQQEQGPSTSASAPDGAASSATGSSTKTECNGVNCTTTTTTTDGSGNVTGTTQTTQKQESFCKENPQSSLCKQSSISGSCGGPVACDGDAIQCAIAADQIKRNCQWFDDAATGPLKDVGDAAMTGQLQGPDHPYSNASSQSVSFGSQLDQTDRLGGGCPQDVSFSLMGKAVVMPMSKACEPLQIVGQLAVAVTALACAFIVFK